MRKRFLFLGAMALTAWASAFGCSDDSNGPGDRDLPHRIAPEEEAGPAAAPDSAAPTCTDLSMTVGEPEACDKCAKAKCCDEILACNDSADCKALQKCLEPCADSDFTCVLTCQSAHDNGSSLLQEVGSCAQNECAAECPSTAPDADIFGDAF